MFGLDPVVEIVIVGATALIAIVVAAWVSDLFVCRADRAELAELARRS